MILTAKTKQFAALIAGGAMVFSLLFSTFAPAMSRAQENPPAEPAAEELTPQDDNSDEVVEIPEEESNDEDGDSDSDSDQDKKKEEKKDEPGDQAGDEEGVEGDDVPAVGEVLGLFAAPQTIQSDPKVEICHEAGKSGKWEIISVSQNAWDEHSGAHGTHDNDFLIDDEHPCPPAEQGDGNEEPQEEPTNEPNQCELLIVSDDSWDNAVDSTRKLG